MPFTKVYILVLCKRDSDWPVIKGLELLELNVQPAGKDQPLYEPGSAKHKTIKKLNPQKCTI